MRNIDSHAAQATLSGEAYADAQNERRFRAMADTAPVLIWMAGVDAKCHYFNKAWLKFRGLSSDDECGHGWTHGAHPDDLEKCRAVYATAFMGRKPFSLDFRLKRHDGIYRWVSNNGAPIYAEDGVFLGYVGSCADISDLKLTEEQLRQSQKLETIGRLAGGVMHDFNNLLTAIHGFTELALPLVTEKGLLQEFLLEIKKSTVSASSLTHQLLAYSRKKAPAQTPVNLNSAVLEMDRMLKRVIREDIEWITSLEPNLGLVLADTSQLQQIILNLVINASDAMPQGGRLTLETANVQFEENDACIGTGSKISPHVLLTVSDSGTGMTPEIQSRIFDPFFTTKDAGHGTGLGLVSVQGIVKQSGGRILVSSQVGQGTIFKIYLPAVQANASPAEPEQSQEEKTLSGSETILVVEDDKAVGKFVQQTLSDYGYTVFNAKDGAEAIVALKMKARIDLIITDVIMPGIHGRQLANEMLAIRPNLSFLFMSGYAESAVLQDGAAKTETAFLQKPFTQNDLLKLIRRLFNEKMQAQESP